MTIDDVNVAFSGVLSPAMFDKQPERPLLQQACSFCHCAELSVTHLSSIAPSSSDFGS